MDERLARVTPTVELSRSKPSAREMDCQAIRAECLGTRMEAFGSAEIHWAGPRLATSMAVHLYTTASRMAFRTCQISAPNGTKNHTLWIPTFRGLAKHNESLALYTTADGLPSKNVGFVRCHPDGSVFGLLPETMRSSDLIRPPIVTVARRSCPTQGPGELGTIPRFDHRQGWCGLGQRIGRTGCPI